MGRLQFQLGGLQAQRDNLARSENALRESANALSRIVGEAKTPECLERALQKHEHVARQHGGGAPQSTDAERSASVGGESKTSTHVDILEELRNEARLRLEQIRSMIEETERMLDAADTEIEEIRRQIEEMAEILYDDDDDDDDENFEVSR